MIDLSKIRSLVKNGLYKITLHAQKRMDQRGITLEELKKVIYDGEVVEEYPGDRPYPSCLFMGKVRGDLPLYVVCGLGPKAHVITVHWLDPDKWLDPKTRREKR